MQIKNIMNQPAITCRTDDTLDQPARLMWEFDCGVVPVIDQDGRLAGVVTDRDICMAAYTQGKCLHDIPVDVAMAHAAIAVHAEDTIEQAETLMRDNQIRRLPVVDDGGLPVGVVSMNDLAQLATRVRRGALDHELVQTLAAVSAPRGRNGHAQDVEAVAIRAAVGG